MDKDNEKNESQDQLLGIQIKYLSDSQEYLNTCMQQIITSISNQNQTIINIGNIIDLQSQKINDINDTINNMLAKLSDMEIVNQNNQSSITTMEQELRQFSNQLQEIKNAVNNIKVYNLPKGYGQNNF
ncbi:MAG: hypothetical protein ACOCP8_00210 [archaeon]